MAEKHTGMNSEDYPKVHHMFSTASSYLLYLYICEP